MKLFYTPRFKKSFNRLPARIQTQAIKQEILFKHDPEDPRLHTHPLKGKLKGLYAFSIGYHYRIVFVFESDGAITFIDIGTHHIYR